MAGREGERETMMGLREGGKKEGMKESRERMKEVEEGGSEEMKGGA